MSVLFLSERILVDDALVAGAIVVSDDGKIIQVLTENSAIAEWKLSHLSATVRLEFHISSLA